MNSMFYFLGKPNTGLAAFVMQEVRKIWKEWTQIVNQISFLKKFVRSFQYLYGKHLRQKKILISMFVNRIKIMSSQPLRKCIKR